MNPTEIEFAVKALVAEPYDPATFVFDLIGIYNAPKITVSKLRSGQTNATKVPGDVLWKKHLYFRSVSSTEDAAAVGAVLAQDPLTIKHNPRFIIVTNGDQVHIRDRQLDETCNTELLRLDESSDFLGPLAGFERRVIVTENPADVKAAKRLAKLYDAILSANPTWTGGNHTHELNVFMTRVLFCFYAEDTGIFSASQLFTSTITQHTHEDGSNVAPLLDRLFTVMNQKEDDRPQTISTVDNRFPYVNGSLFENVLQIPTFNRTARRLFLDCGELDWRTINPDIFGSMIQTIAQPGARGELGMHYTSVPNIMKVLQPLVLDKLNSAYEKAKDSVSKLDALLVRLSQIRVFDPACGCGNFLIIAYKELRQIEMRIIERIGELAPNNPLRLSGISLQSFFGIDVVDFACETAKLSLWIAEYQMNSAFRELFGAARPPLPLGKIATIHNANALRTDWLEVCPVAGDSEIYICGNPPYAGYQSQTIQQKSDLQHVLWRYTTQFKSMDYISGWFVLAAAYAAAAHADAAFVSTNSICQGEQVSMLWSILFSLNAHIAFAYTSFKWSNNASRQAGVTCIIIGLSPTSLSSATLISSDHEQRVSAIGPYLVPDPNRTIVTPYTAAQTTLPLILLGNQPTDGGNLILSPRERADLTARYPRAEQLIRRYMGSDDFINHVERYCLWITDAELALAVSIPEIKSRIEAVRAMRLASPAKSTRDYAAFPHRFRQIQDAGRAALIVPLTFSERRRYLTVGLVGPDTIVNNLAFAIYDPPPYLLAILSSRLHFIWDMTVGGKLENRVRYSNTLVYNTFPVPTLSAEQQRVLAEHSKSILQARAKHPGKTIAWLYNPETMPENILHAHQENDAYIEEYVYGRSFKDDTQRLEHLFSMYATLKAREDAPLLSPASPARQKGRK